MPKLLPLLPFLCLIKASSAAVLVLNPSFENFDIAPWTRTAISGIRPWSLGSAGPQHGTSYVFAVDEAVISQNFSPVLGSGVGVFTFWVDRPESANMFIEFFYQDGSQSGRLSINGGTGPGWGQFNALPLVEPEKRLTGFSVVKTGTGTARLDHFQVESVPEPSSAALAIPALALLLKRRRQTKGRNVS